jgi:hypothetical protein
MGGKGFCVILSKTAAEAAHLFHSASRRTMTHPGNAQTAQHFKARHVWQVKVGMVREAIGYAVRRFDDEDAHPVSGIFSRLRLGRLCWLLGDMNELAFRFPELCLGVIQWAIELGDPSCLAMLARATTLSTRGGPRMRGPISPLSILLGLSAAPSAPNTVISSLQKRRE